MCNRVSAMMMRLDMCAMYMSLSSAEAVFPESDLKAFEFRQAGRQGLPDFYFTTIGDWYAWRIPSPPPAGRRNQ